MEDNKIALSVDIEDWYHTPLITGSSFSRYTTVEHFFKKWEKRYDYITDSTLKIIGIFNKFKINATFFIVADITKRYPKIIEALKNSNHEIGCHGMHHTCAINGKTKEKLQNENEWEYELTKAKKVLENTFQKKIFGYRAPGGYFAKWMIPILEKLNFKYDSSLANNSIYNKTDERIKTSPSHPFFLSKENIYDNNPDSTIMELPWSYFKLCSIKLPGGGAFFYRLLGNKYFIPLLNQNLQRGDTMFYFHSLDIVDEKFPIQSNSYRPYYWLNKGKETLGKLQKLFDKFQYKITTCQEIYEKNNNKLCMGKEIATH